MIGDSGNAHTNATRSPATDTVPLIERASLPYLDGDERAALVEGEHAVVVVVADHAAVARAEHDVGVVAERMRQVRALARLDPELGQQRQQTIAVGHDVPPCARALAE